MSGAEVRRPDRHALLELDTLLARIQRRAAAGDRARYTRDDGFRWVIHRLWIAIGNAAEAYAALTVVGDAEPWRSLRQLRNKLAHVRLPDIDEDEVWRVTMLRTESLRTHVRHFLR